MNINIGERIYEWVKDLFPINRSLTGNGVRYTLSYIKDIVPEMNIFEVESGTKCFDWEVPKEWNCEDAYIVTPEGEKICDFKVNNLHVLGYSTPVDKEISFDELKKHLYFIEDQPDAIPYITSYYKERWGFCIKYNDYKKLKEGNYKVFIDSQLENGSLTYGEVILKGESSEEIFLSTYVCHPSMANNELSGPTVTTALVDYIKSIKNRYYTYRIVYIPETLGSICYLSQNNLSSLKKNIVAGFNMTCIGDDRSYSYIQTRYGNTLSDKLAKYVLRDVEHIQYSFLDRGSDERQYCAPHVDLPVVTMCRTKFGRYPEYHTSLDNLDVVSPKGLQGGYNKMKDIVDLLEMNHYYIIDCFCEPQLGKRGLYPTISTKDTRNQVRSMTDFIAYADGSNDLIDIATIINVDAKDLFLIVEKMLKNGLIKIRK